MERLPAETVQRMVSVRTSAADAEPAFTDVPVRITLPARLVFFLKEVDQDFFTRLRPVVGDGYAANFPYDRYITPEIYVIKNLSKGRTAPDIIGRRCVCRW